MNIYVAHSRHFFDYEAELYRPLQDSMLAKQHHLIFPHNTTEQIDLKAEMKNGQIDLVLAEVSYPATGMGIELGWADAFNIPFICLYKEGFKASGSVQKLAKRSLEYKTLDEMAINKLLELLKDFG